MVEVEGDERPRGYLVELEGIKSVRELLPQLQQVVNVEQLTTLALDCKANLLIDLVLVHELEKVIVAEIGLLVVVKVNQEGLDHLVDVDLADVLCLNSP